ncbi:MAG: metalloregulator ArsR/SmtB family transcription factor [Myxococcota bacterium]|nr:metalloregulator ArsR/SmtB family transcription factor [Myxococcota bacterium]
MHGPAGLFRALADETRLRMMGLLLRRGELCVCDFVEVLGITQSKASRHLRYLLHAGLVGDRREGTWVRYRVADALGRDARVVVRGLRTLLGAEQMSGLEDRLERWLARKSSRGCGASPEVPRGRRTGWKGGRQ